MIDLKEYAIDAKPARVGMKKPPILTAIQF